MQAIWLTRISIGFLAGVLIIGLIIFGRPRPIPVDLATVTSGPMEVAIDEEARTRVRHIYTVSAPVAGKVLRISQPTGAERVSIHIGDTVVAGETVLAVMQPMVPGFLDVRSREELRAVLAAADAAIKHAEAEITRIEVVLGLSRSELQRVQVLARTNVASTKSLERAKADAEVNDAALASSKAQLEVRRSERASVAAKLIEPSQGVRGENPEDIVKVRAPVSGRVLRIIQESETVVQAGAPLIEIGDPVDLEIVAELLSTDAVRIDVGAPVRIDGWGGLPVPGRVTRVDPAGFVKVSALGIEEQRVRTTIDFATPATTWARLGHDFRVIVHVVTWKADAVLTLPAGALFRSGDSWAVFAVRNSRARLTAITSGHRNGRLVEILAGLSAGDRIVLHPSDRIRDGVSVTQRDTR